MTYATSKRGFLKNLGDPRWQGVSGLAAIVATILGVVIPLAASFSGGQLNAAIITERLVNEPDYPKTILDWPGLSWKGSIAQVKIEEINPLNDLLQKKNNMPVIIHIGWSIFLILLVGIFLYIATVLAVFRKQQPRIFSLRGLSLMTMCMLFSISSAARVGRNERSELRRMKVMSHNKSCPTIDAPIIPAEPIFSRSIF
jgi:hypothetical protein